MPTFNLVNGSRVGVNSFLLQVSDEAVDNLGSNKVCEEHSVEKDTLGADDHELHEPAGFAKLHEHQKMHTLVVTLLEERLDPTVVALHAAEAVEVAKHTAYHARHAGNALKKDEANELLSVSISHLIHPHLCIHGYGATKCGQSVWIGCVLRVSTHPLSFSKRLISYYSSGRVLLVDLLFSIHARRLIHQVTGEPHKLPRSPVAKGSRFAMSGFNGKHLFHRVPLRGPRSLGSQDMGSVLGREKVTELLRWCCGKEPLVLCGADTFHPQ